MIEGEPVSLPADLATPVGLVFHELAANAAKYGSLSVVSGRVAVTWTLAARNHDRLLNIIWHEQGGPKVEPPTTSGFGSLLIDNGIPGAIVTREFLPEGVVCTIELPLRRALEHELVA